MKLTVSNKNYCATVVKIERLVALDGCDNVQGAIIFGNNVIVDKLTKSGDIGIYFPIESKLSKEFLSNNSLYRDKTLNKNTSKGGYFSDSGRIKAEKFRGHKSEGFFIPIQSLDYLNINFNELNVGDEFNEINGVEVVDKYVIVVKESNNNSQKQNKAKRFNRLVDEQFRLHYDTSQLAKNMHNVHPDDFISITTKLHGTSAVFSKVLVKRKLSFFEKLLKNVLKVNINDTYYDLVYSSRSVVKNKYINENVNSGFYNEDIWGTVANEIKDAIINGISIYGEIVGYLASGSYIQKPYYYGCGSKEHAFYVYRITYTNSDGVVFELPYLQMLQYCAKYGLTPVPHEYYGKAVDLFPEIGDDDVWGETFLEKMKEKYLEKQSPLNGNKLPEEGVVLRIDRLHTSEAYKLKSFAFLQKESKQLDSGEVDLESIS